MASCADRVASDAADLPEQTRLGERRSAQRRRIVPAPQKFKFFKPFKLFELFTLRRFDPPCRSLFALRLKAGACVHRKRWLVEACGVNGGTPDLRALRVVQFTS